MKQLKIIALAFGLMFTGTTMAASGGSIEIPDIEQYPVLNSATLVTVGATTEAHWRGLDISDGKPAVGINALWLAEEDSATLFESGRWFFNLGVGTADFPTLDGGKSDYFGTARLGMSGKVLEYADLKYRWSINHARFEEDFDQTDFTFGLYEKVTKNTVIGGDIGYTAEIFGEFGDAVFGDIYAKTKVMDDYWLGLKVGIVDDSDVDGYHFGELSISKVFSNNIYAKVDYTIHGGGDDYPEEIIDDSLRLSISYTF